MMQTPRESTWLGHPPGLFVLFATEMWERFSYYGMRALLILYLTKHWLYADGEAAMIYGSYAAMVYAVPVLGGMIADRYLGLRKAIIFGAVLLVAGHLGMAYEGPPAVVIGETIERSAQHEQAFYLALSFIIVGVGFLKANISTIVGGLYGEGDPRRDGGFTIFYMGINLGAFVATLLCAYLGETYGWRYGFGLAGIGMVIGLLTFLLGSKYLAGLCVSRRVCGSDLVCDSEYSGDGGRIDLVYQRDHGLRDLVFDYRMYAPGARSNVVDVAAHVFVSGVLGVVRAGRIILNAVYGPQRGPW